MIGWMVEVDVQVVAVKPVAAFGSCDLTCGPHDSSEMLVPSQ